LIPHLHPLCNALQRKDFRLNTEPVFCCHSTGFNQTSHDRALVGNRPWYCRVPCRSRPASFQIKVLVKGPLLAL
jgi:hypothetical protein